MLKFVDLSQQMPKKRKALARRADFDEIYKRFETRGAAEQAGRCSQCGIPYCQTHCPLHNNIPDWLLLTAEDRIEEAYEVAAETNTLPEICGRICPQDRLCEGNCVIETAGHDAVTIGSVETYITEVAFDNGWVKPIVPPRELEASIGIIGAGPGGFAAAERLRRRGYQVEIYDRYDRPGGLLVYGIPNFKLEKDIVQRRADWLEEGGVTFHLDVDVGRDISLAELREKHDAVLIATGVYTSRDFAMPGSGLDNIVQALDYLTASNRKGLGEQVATFDDGALDAAGKNVAVIGGGDTAMDCVRTAVRQGARSVKCLYRRDHENMPGSRREVDHAIEEGVEFVWLSAPEAFLGDGAVSAVRAQRMRLGVPDASGRQSPQLIEGRELHHRDRPGDQGARVRPGRSAGAVRRAGADRDPLGHRPGRLVDDDDGARRGLCGRRYRARRLARRLGDPRRTRRRRGDPSGVGREAAGSGPGDGVVRAGETT